MDKLGHGIYTPLDVNLLPPLYLIYAENPSDSGKVCSILVNIPNLLFEKYFYTPLD
jgi:hypothetical protein